MAQPVGVFVEILQRAGLRAEVSLAQGVELVASPGDEARVVDLTIGETRVVMIFDEALDL